MANNPQITVDVSPSLATTTDGTSTVTILSVPFHDTTGGQMITFDVVGYDFTNNEVATAKIAVKVKNVSGTLSMVGTPVHLIPIAVGSSAGLSTASLTAVIDGSNIELNVIGVTGRTIKWVAYRNASIEVLSSWTAVNPPQDGYVWLYDGVKTRWDTVSVASLSLGSLNAGGDLAGTYPNPTVTRVTGSSGTIQLGTTSDSEINLYGRLGATVTELNISPTLNGGNFSEMITLYSGNAKASIQIAGNAVSGAGSIQILTQTGGSEEGTITIGAGNVSPCNITLNDGSSLGSMTFIAGSTPIFDTPKIRLGGSNNTYTTASTVGAAGGASALPATPSGYITVNINGTDYKLPYYAT